MKPSIEKMKLSVIVILSIIFFAKCQAPQSNEIDLEPIKNLILFDRYAVRSYELNVGEILKQRDSTSLIALKVKAFSFTWGGEVGGPWTRVLCFVRPSPNNFQCEFLYEGEYSMSQMHGNSNQIKSGANHSLGKQLTQVGNSLGDEVRLDKEKMKYLLISVMEDLLKCPRIRKSFMDSLDINNLPRGKNEYFDFNYLNKKKLIDCVQKIKNEVSINPNPDVIYFHGELINGIWKGTVRQYDHTGRFCIELDYLNGEFAYTMWL